MILILNDEKPIININITKGSATVAYNDLENITRTVNLTEGQKYIFNDENRIGIIN